MGSRRLVATATGALVLGGLGFVVSGCGGSSSAATPPTTTTAGTSTTQAGRGAFAADFQKFQSCLKAHGVTLPTFQHRPGNRRPPTTGPRTTTAPRRFTPGAGRFGARFGSLTAAQHKALQACQKLLPTRPDGRGFGFGRRPGGGAGSQAFTKYTQCLAKHGVTFGKQGQSAGAFAKAQAACRALLPQPGGPQFTPPAPTTTTAPIS